LAEPRGSGFNRSGLEGLAFPQTPQRKHLAANRRSRASEVEGMAGDDGVSRRRAARHDVSDQAWAVWAPSHPIDPRHISNPALAHPNSMGRRAGAHLTRWDRSPRSRPCRASTSRVSPRRSQHTGFHPPLGRQTAITKDRVRTFL